MDFSFRQTFSLLARTTPFLMYRALVYLVIGAAWIVVTAIGAGIGAMLGVIGGSAGTGATIGGFLGFLLCAGILAFARRYLLYMVKAAHIAVLVEVVDGRPLPDGKGQVAYGKDAVKERFTETSVLFAVDQAITGILRRFNRMVVRVADFLPIPGLENLAKIANAIINTSVTYVDEAVLAHNLRVRSQNPWETSRQGIILYAQNYTRFLKNAVKLTFGVWGLTILVFLVVLVPIALLIWVLPFEGGIVALLFSLTVAWLIRATVIEPFAVTAMLQAWNSITADQVPNPEWESRLTQVSDAFGNMVQKARGWVSQRRGAGETAA
ncbi:glycine zipper family protein [Brevibacterium litoralis]|uniref:glycine zipper family protein n=1 Tax=Brevibacterium litoralis TaxID=3138935 RepID=UPI0032EB3BA0